MSRLPFRRVWLTDFEFAAPDGERPRPRCLVAAEWRTGQVIRLWLEGRPPPRLPPIDVGEDALIVAYYSAAEMGCFLALGWPMPCNVLDLYAEMKWLICGRAGTPKRPK